MNSTMAKKKIDSKCQQKNKTEKIKFHAFIQARS